MKHPLKENNGSVSSMAISLPKIEPGVIIPEPVIPHFKTQPIYDGERLIRPSHMGIYLKDGRDGLIYPSFIVGLNPADVSMSNEYLLIVRNVKELQPKSALSRPRRITYLEQRVCVGDLVFVHARHHAKNNPNQFFSRFLFYNVFVDSKSIKNDFNFNVYSGNFIQATVYKINSKHERFYASPLQKITKEEFEENRNRIIRMNLQ